MNKLLYAGFKRLKKDKTFWIGLSIFAVFGIIMCLVQYNNMLKYSDTIKIENTFFIFASVIGIFTAIFTCLFVGRDYSDGTIRNKIIIGHNRKAIYFSNFMISMIASVLISLVFMLIIVMIGIPLLGNFTLKSSTIIWLIIDIVFLIMVYSAIFNMIALLCSNKTISVVLSMLLIFGLMIISFLVLNRLQQPEYVNTTNIVDGETIVESIQNPKYLTSMPRKVYQFVADLIPTSQGFQISGLVAPNIKILALYSSIITVMISSIGVGIFNKKDLK